MGGNTIAFVARSLEKLGIIHKQRESPFYIQCKLNILSFTPLRRSVPSERMRLIQFSQIFSFYL